MAVFKKHLTPLSKKGKLSTHAGKGSSAQVLPSRSALSTLTQGDPASRTMNDYAKATPLANPAAGTPDILGE
jgi:hypothetical protein